MSTYDPAFFKYINNGSTSSAAAIIALIKLYFNVQSVVDFGCGQGAWLRGMEEHGGAREVLGLDGDYVDRDSLLIDRSELRVSDLTSGSNLTIESRDGFRAGSRRAGLGHANRHFSSSYHGLPISIGFTLSLKSETPQKHVWRAQIVLLDGRGLGHERDHARDGQVQDLRLALAGALRL